MDLGGHESAQTPVLDVPLDIILSGYGTPVDGMSYLTRRFADSVVVQLDNRGSSRIDLDGVSFEFIDSVGNIASTDAAGPVSINAGTSRQVEGRLLTPAEFGSRVRVTLDLGASSSIASSFELNVRDAPTSPLQMTNDVTEGYGDEVNLDFVNHGSAPLSFNLSQIPIALVDPAGGNVSQGSCVGPWFWVNPGDTLRVSCFITTPVAPPQGVQLQASMASYYGDQTGERAGTVFPVTADAEVKLLVVPPLTTYWRSLTKGAAVDFTVNLLNQGTSGLIVGLTDVGIRLKTNQGGILAEGRSAGALVFVSPSTSAEFLVPDLQVPLDAPDSLVIEVFIEKTSLPGEAGGPGFLASFLGTTVQPPYNATAATDAPTYSIGQEVTITGEVRDNDGLIVPNADVLVHVRSKGFNRVFDVTADGDGLYQHVFRPLGAEAGKYVVGATHPIVASLERDTTFEILGLHLTPLRTVVEMSQNSSRSFSIDATNIGESTLNRYHPRHRGLAGCGKRARRTDVVGGASSSPTISVIS